MLPNHKRGGENVLTEVSLMVMQKYVSSNMSLSYRNRLCFTFESYSSYITDKSK